MTINLSNIALPFMKPNITNDQIQEIAADLFFESSEATVQTYLPNCKKPHGKALLEWLCVRHGENNHLDFKPKPVCTPFLPISSSWRKKNARETDWTLRVLQLLNK